MAGQPGQPGAFNELPKLPQAIFKAWICMHEKGLGFRDSALGSQDLGLMFGA